MGGTAEPKRVPADARQGELALPGIPAASVDLSLRPAPARPSTPGPPIRLRLLVTVKAYPTLTDKHGEAVCCAGVRLDTPDPEWVRLFPVPHRAMRPAQQFAKYDVVEVQARPASDDNRPESYQPNVDTLVITGKIGTQRGWLDRARFVEPLVGAGLCQVQELGANGPSLHAFRPQRPLVLSVERRAPRSSGKEGIARQLDLMDPSRKVLEDLPYVFKYRYHCGPDCERRDGHHQTILDWEVSQAFRSWRLKYGESGATQRIKEKWQTQIAGEDRDLVLLAGNTNAHRNVWCVLGTYWPPVTRQEQLFADI